MFKCSYKVTSMSVTLILSSTFVLSMVPDEIHSIHKAKDLLIASAAESI